MIGVRHDVVGRALGVRFDESLTVERFERARVQTFGTVVFQPQQTETLFLDIVLNEPGRLRMFETKMLHQ